MDHVIDERELQRIEALAQAATPGPWFGPRISDDWPPGWIAVYEADLNGDPMPGYVIGLAGHALDPESNAEADAAFIASARSAVPAIVAEVRRLREELESIGTHQNIYDTFEYQLKAMQRQACAALGIALPKDEDD